MTRAANRKRLKALEAPTKPAERRGLLVLPPILDVDTWSAIAEPQQAALAEATRQGVDDAPNASSST